MAQFNDVLPDVLPDVPDCLDVLMVNAIRNAVIQFCSKTHVWEVDLPAINVVQGTAEYTIVQPTEQRIIRLTQVIAGGREIEPTTATALSNASPVWRNTTSATATAWMMMNPRLLRVYPTPDADSQITMKAIVKPSPAAVNFDDFIYDDYHMAIAAGAKALLCAMPHKPWTALELVPYYKSIFQDGINQAKLSRSQGFANADLSVQQQVFGG